MKKSTCLRPGLSALVTCLLILLARAWLQAQDSPDSHATQRESPSALFTAVHSDTPDIRIGPGDLLEIHVYGSPELTQTVRVSNGGEINLPLIGNVVIAGLTSAQAEHEIERQYVSGGYLRKPQANVLIKEYASQGVSVLGEVAKPGIYPLGANHRLYDVISSAGGTTNRAGRVISITHRADPAKPELVALSSDPSLLARANVDVQPGDTVMVSKSGIVYVTGDVRLPGGYVLEQNENLTVLQAIALAQGLNSTASLKSVRIIRRTGSTFEEIPVQLKAIMAAKSPDVLLKNEDVLLVPNSASKTAARRSLESVVQVATGVAIYRR